MPPDKEIETASAAVEKVEGAAAAAAALVMLSAANPADAADADAVDPAAAAAIFATVPVDGEIGNAQSPTAAYLLPDGHDYGEMLVWDHPRGVAREDDVIAGLEWGCRRSRRRSRGDEVVLFLLLCHVVSSRGSLEVRRRRPPRWRRAEGWWQAGVAHSGSVFLEACSHFLDNAGIFRVRLCITEICATVTSSQGAPCYMSNSHPHAADVS